MRDSGPVRKDVTSDTDENVPHEYVGMARTLLGQLKGRMAAGGLAQLMRTVNMPDGTVISVASIHGQDTIRIYRPNGPAPRVPGVPPPPPVIEPPVVPERERTLVDVCVRGPDVEVYSAPFTTSGLGFAAAAMNTARDTVYLIAGAPDWTSYTDHTSVGNESVLYRLDSKLATVSGGATAYPAGAADVGSFMVHYDRASDQFFTAVYTLDGFRPLGLPPDPVVYNYTQVWGENGATGQISTVVGTHTDVFGIEWSYMDLILSEGTADGIVLALGFNPPGNDPALSQQVWGGGHIASFAPGSWSKIAEIRDTAGAGGGGFNGPGYDDAFRSVVTPAGNIVVHVKGNGGSNALYSVSAQDGSTVTDWGVVPGAHMVTARMRKGSNGDKELWAASDTGVYKNSGSGWEVVPDVGAPLTTGPGVIPYNMLNLAYDESNDAMAVILPDGSGAHIFGGHDCMGIPLAPFVFKFKNAPAFDAFFCTQFEKGTLLITYMRFDADIANTVASTMIVGRYDIGLLNQRRATQYE